MLPRRMRQRMRQRMRGRKHERGAEQRRGRSAARSPLSPPPPPPPPPPPRQPPQLHFPRRWRPRRRLCRRRWPSAARCPMGSRVCVTAARRRVLVQPRRALLATRRCVPGRGAGRWPSGRRRRHTPTSPPRTQPRLRRLRCMALRRGGEGAAAAEAFRGEAPSLSTRPGASTHGPSTRPSPEPRPKKLLPSRASRSRASDRLQR
mmetsp:Transcript_25063/g.72110  ORF Transcript_25063/g.72110 Transcript_25063/m.72110 type:complete len:204 (+) Transcript_25063:497-1108(+)